MTCIVAVTTGKVAWMASDSQITDNGAVIIGGSKVHRKDDGLLLGCDGSAAYSDALRWHAPGPGLLLRDMGLAEWLTRRFVPWLWEFAKERNLLRTDDGRAWLPGSVLAAHAGQLAVVGRDGCVVQSVQRYMAVGSGRAEALGALTVLVRQEPALLGHQLATLAVGVACELDDGCREPIHCHSTAVNEP